MFWNLVSGLDVDVNFINELFSFCRYVDAALLLFFYCSMLLLAMRAVLACLLIGI
jgi:hypothetical protein